MSAVPLTGDECAAILQRLSRTFASSGIDLKALDLWHDLEDIRWLSQFGGPVLGPEAEPYRYNRKKTISGFRDAVFIKRTTVALERASHLLGFKDHVVKHLKNWRIRMVAVDDTEAPTQAMDHLFEAEVAARLSFTFSRIRFDEPDLVIEDPESPISFSIACKRPRRLKTMVAKAKEGASQVQREGMAGLVLLSADHVVDQVVRDFSGRSLRPECERRINQVVEACSGEILQRLEEFPPVRIISQDPVVVTGVTGAFILASFLLLGRDGPSGELFMNTAVVPCMINRNEPKWAQGVTAVLLSQIQDGENRLIAS